MSLFGKILDKLGLSRSVKAEAGSSRTGSIPAGDYSRNISYARRAACSEHRSPSSMLWPSWRNSLGLERPKAQLERSLSWIC